MENKKRKNLIFTFSLFLVLLITSPCIQKEISEIKSIRKTAYAGTWYPGDNKTLDSAVQGYLDKANKVSMNGTIRAIIVPHAGYVYSGQVAAVAFKQLNDVYKRVFILGPSHQYPLTGAIITNATHYETPLGEVKIADKSELIKSGVSVNTLVDSKEHSLEIEIPFLQKMLSSFEILPLVVGNTNPNEFKSIIERNIRQDDLIVVSADLSHYHKYDEAVALDSYSVGSIANLDADGILNAEIDAPWAVATLLLIAKEKGWKPKLLFYANSGDVTGDKSSVVGYSAIAFVEEEKKEAESEPLTKEEQEFLLKLARATVENYVKDGKVPALNGDMVSSAMAKTQGCLVTLTKSGNLRGCIGDIMPERELYKCVIGNAVNAAVNDPRFNPVTADELKDISVEISVLSVPEELKFSSPEDLLSKLRPNIDGVVLTYGFHRSTYLPQVWEQLPDKQEFLASLCVKGGSSADCWKDSKLKVETYQAFVFNEE